MQNVPALNLAKFYRLSRKVIKNLTDQALNYDGILNKQEKEGWNQPSDLRLKRRVI